MTPALVVGGEEQGRERWEWKRWLALIFEQRKTETWGIIGWDLG